MSDTTLVDVVAVTQLVLAFLGLVMSFVTLTRLWMKLAAAAVFLAAGVIGVLCVHQIAASAERQQTDARQEQRALSSKLTKVRSELGALKKEQASTTTAVSALDKDTKALGNRPLRVTAVVPKEPAPTIWWHQNALRLDPSADGKRYAVEVTLKSDKQLDQAEFRWICDAPIASPEFKLGTLCWHNIDGKEIRLRLMSPALSPSYHWVFVLYSETPIRVSGVRWVGSSPVPTMVEQ